MADLYISDKDESARMFKSDFMERFSRVHPVVPLAIFLPIIGTMIYLATLNRVRFGFEIGLFAAGFFIWSLAEYAMHRTIFHFEPKTALQHRLWFIIHGVHHNYPNDSRRLVMPPSLSIPIGAFFYILFRLILGAEYVPSFFAGFAFGYLTYDMSHYAIHHFKPWGRIGLFIQRHHLRHHFQDPGHNFGVSSPLWDFVFGTYGKKRA